MPTLQRLRPGIADLDSSPVDCFEPFSTTFDFYANHFTDCRVLMVRRPMNCQFETRLPSMSFLRSSPITEGCITRSFAEQPANTSPVYPLRQ